MRSRAHLTFGRVQSPGPATVLGVVVHEHVVGDGEDVAVHVDRGRHHHLGTKRQSFTRTKTATFAQNGTVRKIVVSEILSVVRFFFVS